MKTKPGPLAQMDSEQSALKIIKIMGKIVGERATGWTVEGRKSAHAFDQPQEFCGSFTTRLRIFNIEIIACPSNIFQVSKIYIV